MYIGMEALCIHNPATGREETIPHVVPRPTGRVAQGRRGRGRAPAGWRRRGSPPSGGIRSVVLEAADQPGGQIVLAAAGDAATW